MQPAAMPEHFYPYADGHIQRHKRYGVYWSAIIGGAIAATAVSLLLLALGAGLGFGTVSPWYHTGASAKTVTLMTVVWLVIMQWLSSGLGGYLTGRLRNGWHGFHADEGFFRDTAHGFLTWAIATILVAIIVSSAAAQTIRSGAYSRDANTNNGPAAYYIDQLYRTNGPAHEATNRDTDEETARILMRNMSDHPRDQDITYLAQLVADHTSLSQTEAEARVSNVLAQEKSDVDEGRKAASYFALFTFFAMMVGAFIACVAAALGGMHRDEYDSVTGELHLQPAATAR